MLVTLQNCRRNGSSEKHEFLTLNLLNHIASIERNGLDLVPLSEAPARTLEYDELHKSSLISLSDFEAYLERAKQLDLFNEQHGVSCAVKSGFLTD
jgi:hypothetical protein